MAKNMGLELEPARKKAKHELFHSMARVIKEAAGIRPEREVRAPKRGRKSREHGRGFDRKQEKPLWAKAVEAPKQGQAPGKLEASLPLERSRVRIESALSQNPTLKEWLLPKGESLSSPIVAQVVTEIAESPLRDDPDFLLMKGARLNASLAYEDQLEGQSVLRGIKKRVLEMRGLPTRLSEEARRLMNADQQREFLFIQNALGEIGTPAAGGAGTGLGGGVPPQDILHGLDLSSLDKKLSLELRNIAGYVQGSPESEYAMQVAYGHLENLRRNSKDLTLEQEELLTRLSGKVGELYQRTKERVSPISLTKLEEDNLENDPLGTIEHIFHRLERAILSNPEGPDAQNTLQRLRLHMDYFLNESYDIRRAHLISSKNGVRLDGEYLAGIKAKIGAQKERYLEMYTKRFNLIHFYQLWRVAPNLQDTKFQGFINLQLREQDIFGADTLYGGMVGDAARLFKRIYQGRKWDAAGDLRFIPPEDWLAAKEELKALMRANPVYKDKYEAYLKSFSELSATQAHRVAPEFDKAVDSIVDLASIRTILWGDEAAIDIQGQAPLHGDLVGHRSTFLLKEKIHKLKRYWTWHVSKWGGAGKASPLYERVFAYHEGMVYAKAFPKVNTWARELSETAWQQLEKYRHHLHEVVNRGGKLEDAIPDRQTREEVEKFLGKMQIYYYYNPTPDKIILPCANDQRYWGEPGIEKFSEYLLRLNQKDLEKQLVGYCGLHLADSHGLRPYWLLESGWRRREIGGKVDEFIDRHLGAIYGEEKKEMWQKRVFTAKKLLDAANGYYDHQMWGDPQNRQDKFVAAMDEIACVRPHELAEVMAERGNKEFLRWFDSNKTRFGNFSHQGEMFTAYGLRVAAINREVLKLRGMPLDYSQGFPAMLGVLNETQRTAVDATLRGLSAYDKITAEQFYSGMHEMTKFLRDKGSSGKRGIEYLLDIRYEPLLTNRSWDDDLPIDLMEDEDLIKQYNDEHPDKPRLFGFSREFTARGESHGPGKRFWRDLGAAESVFDKLAGLVTTDTKELYKVFQEAVPVVNAYQGDKHAGFLALGKIGGWEGTARVYPQYGPFFEGSPNSSDIKRYLQGKSMSADELKHTTEEMYRTIANVIPENVQFLTPMAEAVEEHTGVSSWRKVLGGHGGWMNKAVNIYARALNTVGIHADGDEMFNELVKNLRERAPGGVVGVKALVAIGIIAGFLALYTFSTAKKRGGEKDEEH